MADRARTDIALSPSRSLNQLPACPGPCSADPQPPMVFRLAQRAPLFLSTGALPRHCPGGPSLHFLQGLFALRGSVFLAPRLTGRWNDSDDLEPIAILPLSARRIVAIRTLCRPPTVAHWRRSQGACIVNVRSISGRNSSPSPTIGSASSTTAASFVCVIHACERGEPMPIYPQKRTTSAGLPALQRKCHILALAPAKGCETQGPSELTEPWMAVGEQAR